jgi:GrpB-like predicted nucleotidyltransferase (UPF0157 family)
VNRQRSVEELVRERIEIVPYDRRWPQMFRDEAAHLRACLPADVVGRIEHFGSTAVPGLAAKPVVDMLVEVTDLPAARERIAPILQAQNYDYVWRPTHGDDGPPWYAWFIKRDLAGARTHHIHMVEPGFAAHWERLLFRDYLIERPDLAREYESLKRALASRSADDRIAYTRDKSEYIARVTAEAKRRYRLAE